MDLVQISEMHSGSGLALLRTQLTRLFCFVIDSLSREVQLDMFAWGRSGGDAAKGRCHSTVAAKATHLGW
jgi:hypothetical protein